MAYVNLHLHSVNSIKDGAIKIPTNIKKEPFKLGEVLNQRGETACALTDHGNMIGIPDWKVACEAYGIKPIYGCEVYVAPWGDSMYNKKSLKKKKKSEETDVEYDENSDNENIYNHLILLVKDEVVGYRNLCRIVSIGYTKGFYKKPRIDFEVLEQYHDGLICLSACAAGAVPQAIINGDYNKAKEIATAYKDLFKDDYYLEVQNHGLDDEMIMNEGIFKLSEELGIKVVATNDAHYLNPEDAKIQDIVVTAGYKQKIKDPNRTWVKYYGNGQNYVKSEEEMLKLFPEHPEAIYNTVEVADKCNCNLDKLFLNIADHDQSQIHLPNVDDYDHNKYSSQAEYFRDLVLKGMEDRYGSPLSQELVDRMNFELSIIEPMGFINYFLLVRDYCIWAKDNGIPIGPSRGSAGASCVAYALRITEINPIKYDLDFERFLNPERLNYPDVDTDMGNKDDIYNYAVEKYGKDNVCHVLNLSILKARSSLQEVARILDFTPKEVDDITKLIPEGNQNITLQEALETSLEIQTKYNSDARFKELYDDAMLIEGIPNHTGIHASAIIIADKPVMDYAPVLLTEKSNVVACQYQGGTQINIESFGLIKMDFLGLQNLLYIEDCRKLIHKDFGINLDFTKIDLNDYPEMYQTLKDNSLGIFQFESAGMSSLLKKALFDTYRIKNCKTQEEKNKLGSEYFDRTSAVIALYRPGPMDFIPQWLSGMENPENVIYPTEAHKKILGKTYGTYVYQEQIMKILRDIGGFSLGQADICRRGIAKKHTELVFEQKENFINGALAKGYSQKVAEDTWAVIERSADYGFNASHAIGYNITAIQTLYLSHFYKPQYFAAVLSNTDGDDLKKYISACKNKLGLKISHPDINLSSSAFTTNIIDKSKPVSLPDGTTNISNFEIIFGLNGIEGLSDKTVLPILQEREANGPFTSYLDFVKRCEPYITIANLRNLILSGCFDSFDKNRQQLSVNAQKLLENIREEKKRTTALEERKQKELARAKEAGEEPNPKKWAPRWKKELDWTEEITPMFSAEDRAFAEKDVTGTFFDFNPISKFNFLYSASETFSTIEEILNNKANQNKNRFALIGVFSSPKKKTSKNTGKSFVELTFSDETYEIQAVAYSDVLASYESQLMDENSVHAIIVDVFRNENKVPERWIIKSSFDASLPNIAATIKANWSTSRAKAEQGLDANQKFEPGATKYPLGVHILLPGVTTPETLNAAIQKLNDNLNLGSSDFYINYVDAEDNKNKILTANHLRFTMNDQSELLLKSLFGEKNVVWQKRNEKSDLDSDNSNLYIQDYV